MKRASSISPDSPDNALSRQSLPLYLTDPAPCPYLPELRERKLLAVLPQDDGGALLEALLEKGFRRASGLAYRPHCEACRACVPVRVPLARFSPSRNQKKLLRRNAGLFLSVRASADIRKDEHFALFSAYQRGRHADSPMADMDAGDFGQMVDSCGQDCRFLELRDAERQLVAALQCDVAGSAVSAVYSYFHPDMPPKSLGRLLVLHMLIWAMRQGKSHAYLGYWIGGCRKMSYKSQWRPLEAFRHNRWEDFDHGIHEREQKE